MAIILVPTDYTTLALAVAVASNGDSILLEDGDHAVPTPISTVLTNVRVLAQNPGHATITPTTSVFGAGTLGAWEFHDLRFILTPVTATLTTGNATACYYRCTFDMTGRVANSTTAVLTLGTGSVAGRRVIVRDCLFLNNPAYLSGRCIFVTAVATNPTLMAIEGNVMDGMKGSSSSYSIQIAGTIATGSTIHIRNNTTTRTTFTGTTGANIRVSAVTSGAGDLSIINNVFDENSGSNARNILVASSISLWDVSFNSRHYYNTPPAFIFGGTPGTSTNNETSDVPLLDSRYIPESGGLAYHNGTHSTLKDQQRNSFATTPSRGAREHKDNAGRVSAQWTRIPFISGLTLDLGTPVPFPAFSYESFEDSRDVALALTRLVAMYADSSDAGHGWECWYDGAYRSHAEAPYDISTAGVAATLLGSYTDTSETSSTLSRDPYTMDTPYLIDEDVIGEEARSQIEKTDIGRVYAPLYPEDSRRWVYKFALVTPPEDVRQTGRTAAERVMEAYHRGTPLRVYRRMHNIDPWSTTNTEGYSDIVPQSITDNLTHEWYDSIRTRFQIEIEGVEIR